MRMRRLGGNGPLVSALGLGCMGMSQSYGAADDCESVATIDRALELGVNFFDTSDVYAHGRNEELVGAALRSRRADAVLATKFGVSWTPDRSTMLVDGSPANARRCCEASLRRLATDHIDLYYLHRVDPTVPIEETVGAMRELVDAGKVGQLGLSEASAATLRRAARVHPIAALQSEWSLWTRDLETEVRRVAHKLGTTIVPYSPLGRGFLTGTITTPEDFAPDDVRRRNPRFQGENFADNLRLVEAVTDMATEPWHGFSRRVTMSCRSPGPSVAPTWSKSRRPRCRAHPERPHSAGGNCASRGCRGGPVRLCASIRRHT